MAQTLDLFARRVGSDFDLFHRRSGLDGRDYRLGRLADCEVAYVFVSDNNEDLEARVNCRLEGDMSIRERLEVVRAAYEAQRENERSEAEAEAYAEGGWLRAAEYRPEHADEMAREDAMGLS